jgi:hypothetical protein
MKTLILACAALAGLAAAAPAAAHTDPGGINRREASIHRAINYCVSHDMMNARYATGLRVDLRRIERTEQQMRRGGLSRVEIRRLHRALDRVEGRLQPTCNMTVQ